MQSGGGDDGAKSRRRIEIDHFAETGRFFYEMIELSKLQIPTVCVVFGSSTAGGAYQPGLSDYNIVVKDQSKAFLAGPPLVKMATGEESDDETLGGAQLHAEVSGLGDYFAQDEMDAIRMCREVISHLNWRKAGPDPSLDPEQPAHDPEELLGLVSRDLRQPLDMREVIPRVVDGSRFRGVQDGSMAPSSCADGLRFTATPSESSPTMECCIRIRPRRAPLSFSCATRWTCPSCSSRTSPGFMVGKDFEADGIIKKGSQMINAVANSTVPHLTVIIGSSYGAGTYGMSGRAFGNRFTWLWPTAKIAVMGPKQIAGVMSQVRRGQARTKRRGVRRGRGRPSSWPPWKPLKSEDRWPFGPAERSATTASSTLATPVTC